MRLSLRLIATFVGVISVTAALVMLLANRIITIQFNTLISETGIRYARRIAPALARYYNNHNGWSGIDTAISKFEDNIQSTETFLPGGSQLFDSILREDRLLLLDNSDKLILDTRPDETVPLLTPAILRNGVPITAKNQQKVGTLLSASSIGALTQAQKTFLTQINFWMVIAALLIILAVSVASVFVARSILAPVRSLAQAAHRVSTGDYSLKLSAGHGDELGEMADSFNLMVNQLQEQRDLRRRSMADVAHELRTPLSVLQVELEGIEDGLTPASPESMRVLQSEVEHLNHLVEDLRILSLVDAKEFSLEMAPLNLGELINEVVDRLSESARIHEISLSANIQSDRLEIIGDSQRLAQVLINLVTNAIRHTPAGGLVVIGAVFVHPWVQAWVQDTGSGIPAADLPHVFERFYRSDKARSRDKGGSGLGLAIAGSLIEAHEGKIWVESQEGHGAKFIFYLPGRESSNKPYG